MEKRKYVARPGIKPRTLDLRVRCPTDCATRPGASVSEFVLQRMQISKKKTISLLFFGGFFLGGDGGGATVFFLYKESISLQRI